MRLLFLGQRGPDVRAVQQALNLNRKRGEPELVANGTFGTNTDAAVRRFQKRKVLDPDGVVGPQTLAALFPLGVVTVRAIGMRLRLPTLLPGAAGRPGTRSTGSSVGQGLGGLTLPRPLSPVSLFTPVAYPRLRLPLLSPQLAPPTVPGLTLPVDHFEVQPGTAVSLGKRVDVAFSLTMSGVVMIGPSDRRHQEFSSGIATSTPGVFEGGDWTVAWFAQFTHVEQLARVGNFSWQPNAQVAAGNGSRPFFSATAAPANVQFDVGKLLSVSIGGPSVSATFSPEGATVGWGLGSFGLVGKF
jgi:hypothetical protein